MTTHLAASRIVPGRAAEVYERVIVMPLETIFSSRHLAIPPIRETRDEPPAAWGEVGQTRTVVLADGATMNEELTSVDPGTSFGYTITQITGPMSLLVSQADGAWTFTDIRDGCEVRWTWEVHPRGIPGRVAMPAFAAMWRGSARKGLASIERNL